MCCFGSSSSKKKPVKKPYEYSNAAVKNVQFGPNERKLDKAALSKGRLTKEEPLKMQRASKKKDRAKGKGKGVEVEVNVAEMYVGDIRIRI